MKQATLNVPGMSCGSCVNKIEGNVGKVNGVESVKVQLMERKVAVRFNESVVDLEEIKSVIKDSGYEVEKPPAQSCSCCS